MYGTTDLFNPFGPTFFSDYGKMSLPKCSAPYPSDPPLLIFWHSASLAPIDWAPDWPNVKKLIRVGQTGMALNTLKCNRLTPLGLEGLLKHVCKSHAHVCMAALQNGRAFAPEDPRAFAEDRSPADIIHSARQQYRPSVGNVDLDSFPRQPSPAVDPFVTARRWRLPPPPWNCWPILLYMREFVLWQSPTAVVLVRAAD